MPWNTLWLLTLHQRAFLCSRCEHCGILARLAAIMHASLSKACLAEPEGRSFPPEHQLGPVPWRFTNDCILHRPNQAHWLNDAMHAGLITHLSSVHEALGLCTQVRKLNIDATISNAVVRFAGTQMPLAAAGRVVVSGPVALARQVPVPPCLSHKLV